MNGSSNHISLPPLYLALSTSSLYLPLSNSNKNKMTLHHQGIQ